MSTQGISEFSRIKLFLAKWIAKHCISLTLSSVSLFLFIYRRLWFLYTAELWESNLRNSLFGMWKTVTMLRANQSSSASQQLRNSGSSTLQECELWHGSHDSLRAEQSWDGLLPKPHESQEADERQAHHPAGGGEGPGHRQRAGADDQVEHVHQPHLQDEHKSLRLEIIRHFLKKKKETCDGWDK